MNKKLRMKRVGTLSVLVLLILCLVATPTIRAAKPEKLIEHEIIDGPFGEPEPQFYAKGVMHGVLVARVVGETVRAKIGMTQKLNIYELVEGEAGEFIGVMNLHMNYEGTIIQNGEMEMWTGTYSATWTIILHVDISLPFPEGSTLKGHITRIYREGEYEEIIHGVPPFELP